MLIYLYNFIFERLVLDAIFIPFAILLLLSFFGIKEYKNVKAFRFLLLVMAAFLSLVGIQYIKAKGNINTRYLFPFAICIIAICPPGIETIKKIITKFVKLPSKYIYVPIAVIISVSCIAKALNPPDNKKYIHTISKYISELSTKQRPLIVTNVDDYRRIAWHAKSDYYTVDRIINLKKTHCIVPALEKLHKLRKQPTFLLLKMRASDFNKLFKANQEASTQKLYLITEQKVKTHVYYSLYKFRE